VFVVPVTLLAVTQVRGLATSELEVEQKIAESLPSSARANLKYCVMLVGSGEFDNAVIPCRTAVGLMPGESLPYFHLGNALHGIDDFEEAAANYQMALEIDGDLVEAHNSRGVSLQRLSRTEEAIGHYQEALRINPDYTMAHNNLGICLAGQGRLEEAAEHFRETLRLKPDDRSARGNLRRIELRLQQNRERRRGSPE
jgi:Flp pilus assembly protein TadD